MNGFNGLFELIGGRKFGLAGAVAAALLTLVGTSTVEGEAAIYCIAGSIFVAIFYCIANVWKAEVDGKNGQSKKGEVKE